ncbi:MAG: transposase [Proteobacteria bacterium]|nr:transposase [Pseudomonadota bacterium]
MNAPKKRGRPESIPQEARWKLRECYKAHYCQWGPSVLREWAIREGLGRWNASTISKVIADLKPKPEKKAKPNRYEIAAPMVMWSEDGTQFKERGKKKELLVLQDECARYKINWELANGPANAVLVAEYLHEAFEQYGAPLVLKHDGDSIFHEQCVRDLLDEYSVVDLTSPPSYPPFNGKKERSMRDIKSYTRALFENRVGNSLEERIAITMHDLNDERPRPVLKGMTAAEVFNQTQTRLPNRRRFKMEVETKRRELEAEAGSRTEKTAARRRAVIQVLSSYNLINWRSDVSTYLRSQTGTD